MHLERSPWLLDSLPKADSELDVVVATEVVVVVVVRVVGARTPPEHASLHPSYLVGSPTVVQGSSSPLTTDQASRPGHQNDTKSPQCRLKLVGAFFNHHDNLARLQRGLLGRRGDFCCRSNLRSELRDRFGLQPLEGFYGANKQKVGKKSRLSYQL